MYFKFSFIEFNQPTKKGYTETAVMETKNGINGWIGVNKLRRLGLTTWTLTRRFPRRGTYARYCERDLPILFTSFRKKNKHKRFLII